MGDSLHMQQKPAPSAPQPSWRRRSVAVPGTAAFNQQQPAQALQQQQQQQQQQQYHRPSLPTISPPKSHAGQLPPQQQQQQKIQQQAVNAAIVSSKSSSLGREVGTVPMQWANKHPQPNSQPAIGPRPPALDWHGESTQPRLSRSKSVHGGGETIRLLRSNQELQERLGKTERQLEDERRNHILTVRSMESSLQEQRSHLQEERKVSGALNRDLQRQKAEHTSQAKMFEQESLPLSATQREQLSKELRELKNRLVDVQRCVSPYKQLSGSLRRSPTGEEARLSGTSLLSHLRRANQQLAAVSGQLVTQRSNGEPSSQGASDDVIAEVHDLVQLDGAASEKAIISHLQRRLTHGHNVTLLGPVTVVMNSFARVSEDEAVSPLGAIYDALPASASQLCTLTQSIVNQLRDGATNLSVLLSGETGSGKTFVSQLLVRSLFENVSAGLLAEPFKHYAAAATVLHPMITGQTAENNDSSRVGVVTELQLTGGSIVRTRFHLYFVDQAHVFRSTKDRSMYRVLNFMLASLTAEDRAKLQVESLSQEVLKHLVGTSLDHVTNAQAEYARWKLCVARFGIPITDVLRVLMAVVLLSGIQFVLDSRSGSQLDIKGTGNELKLVASLLGVSPVSLYQGLTTRTRLIRGQSLRSCADPIAANNSRDALSQSLYIRTLNAIVKRVNTMKQRQPPPPPKRKPTVHQKPAAGAAVDLKKTRRSASDGDRHDRALPQIPKQPRSPPEFPPPPPLPDSRGSDTPPQQLQQQLSDSTSRIGRHSDEKLVLTRADTVMSSNLKLGDIGGSKQTVSGVSKSAPAASGTEATASAASPTVTAPIFSHVGSQSLSIIDLFGFQGNARTSCPFQQLCCNVTAEAFQQMFQNSIFKRSSMECRIERVSVPFEAEYDNRSECFQLFTEQHSGIFSLMTKECAMPRIAVENFVGKVASSHSTNACCAGVDNSGHSFSIRHYHSKVSYDAAAILESNRDTIADDVVNIFQSPNCSFGFASHLFSAETKMAAGGSGARSPRGVQHRVTPQASTASDSESGHSLVLDFQTKLDALLYMLEQEQPHYVHCVKSNDSGAASVFDDSSVARQLRQLDVPDTLALFKYGYSQQWSIEKFNQRFSSVARSRHQKVTGETLAAGILKSVDNATTTVTSQAPNNTSAMSSDSKTSNLVWAVGEKMVLFSEVTLQLLERRRDLWRERSIIKLQSHVRRWLCAKRWPSIKKLLVKNRNLSDPGDIVSECTTMSIPLVEHDSETCVFAAEGYSPPPLPKTRAYTVIGNVKIGFPQARKMSGNFPEYGEPVFVTGQEVHLVGVSANRRGYIRVARGDSTVEVPHKLMRFEKNNIPGEAVSLL